MTTKNLLQMVPLAILLAITIPASSAIIVPDSSITKNTTATENPRVNELLNRLEQIKNTKKSELSRTEKKELRKEVKEIKKEMKAISGGVYLSIGAIIIIILLLILIL